MRGTAFLGLLGQVKQKFGERELAEVLAALPPETGEAFAQRIRKSDWFMYSQFTDFLRSIDRRLGRGDLNLCRELGAFAGRSDINTVFKMFKWRYGPTGLIRSCSSVWWSKSSASSCSSVWDHYYRNAGSMEAVAWTPESTVLRIVGFPDMDPAHCRLMEGWMISTMDSIGAKVHPGASETRCTSRGDDCHEFTCSWSLA